MFVCKRCVLTSRLLFVSRISQDFLQMARFCRLYKITAQTGSSLLHRSFLHRLNNMGKIYRSQRYGDRQIRSSPCLQTANVLQDFTVRPVKNSKIHQTDSTPDSPFADQNLIEMDAVSSLSPFKEISDEDAIQITVPLKLPPSTFTLADYVDKSEMLTKLVQIGVNLSKLEQRPNVGSMLIRLDFQADVMPRLLFLKDLGVEDLNLGAILTRNPFILTESIENLQARVSYLKSKKFSSEAVSAMVSKAPYLLNFSVKRLDNRLGFFQQHMGLSAQKTRDVVSRLPRLLCGSLEPIKENLKVCELEFGFRRNEIQHIVNVVPKVLTANKRKLAQVFDFVHNTMGVPHSLITKFPQVLNAKFLRLKERHLFLEYLGHAHYEPSHPNYISLERLVALPDEVFCTEIALASLEDFERFQKTL